MPKMMPKMMPKLTPVGLRCPRMTYLLPTPFCHDDNGPYFCSDDQWFLLLPTMMMTYLFPKMMPKLTPVVPFVQDDTGVSDLLPNTTWFLPLPNMAFVPWLFVIYNYLGL